MLSGIYSWQYFPALIYTYGVGHYIDRKSWNLLLLLQWRLTSLCRNIPSSLLLSPKCRYKFIISLTLRYNIMLCNNFIEITGAGNRENSLGALPLLIIYIRLVSSFALYNFYVEYRCETQINQIEENRWHCN